MRTGSIGRYVAMAMAFGLLVLGQAWGAQPTFNPDSGPSAWTDNRYKLVKPARGRWELYDLMGDLAETTDLAAKQPDIVNRMKVELEKWQQSVVRSYRGEDYPGNRPAGAAPGTRGPVEEKKP